MRIRLLPLIVAAALLGPVADTDAADELAVGDMGGEVHSVDLAPVRGQIAVGRGDGVIVLADAETLVLGDMVGRHGDAVLSVLFSDDETLLLTAGLDSTIRLWNVDKHRQTAEFHGHTDGVWVARFGLDDGTVVSAGADGTVRIWDIATQAEIRRFTEHRTLIRCFTFTNDGKYLVSGDDSGRIFVRDWRQDGPLTELRRHEGKVRNLRMLPDGSLASSSSDGTVRFWDLEGARQIGKLQAHTVGRHGKAYALVFNSDFSRFVTGSEDTTAKLWDAPSLTFLDQAIGHTRHIATAAFADDDASFYTGSLDETVRRWSVSAAD